MEQSFIKHGDNIITINGNARCANGDCPYINEVGDCPGNIENCEYRQPRNDAFLNYTFDGLRQFGNRCVAAHAIVRNQRLLTSVEFLDKEK